MFLQTIALPPLQDITDVLQEIAEMSQMVQNALRSEYGVGKRTTPEANRLLGNVSPSQHNGIHLTPL
jgi:hypothetical protein